MTRLYTGAGDDGTTGLLFGGRVRKDSAIPEACGAADEAQACIGLARAEARVAGGERSDELDGILTEVERDLWVLMAELATAPDNRDKLVEGKTAVTVDMVARLESLVDDVGARFEPPREFVVPGQDRLSALLDVARTVVRRAERAATAVAADDSQVVPYLNRLSSLLWALARWVEGDALAARQR